MFTAKEKNEEENTTAVCRNERTIARIRFLLDADRRYAETPKRMIMSAAMKIICRMMIEFFIELLAKYLCPIMARTANAIREGKRMNKVS